MVEAIVILLTTAGWPRALLVASGGRRNGQLALLALSVFNVVSGLYDLQFVLNGSMPWPEQLMVILLPVTGVIAAAVLC